MVYIRKSLWVSSTDQWVTFYGWIRAEGLKVLKKALRDNYWDVRFKGTIGSVQDYVELRLKQVAKLKVPWKWCLSKKGNWPMLKLGVQLSYVFFKRGRFKPVLVIWWRKPTFTVWHIYWYQLCINTRKRPNLNETNISWRKGVKVFLMNSVRRVLLLADEWCLFDVKA